MGIQDFFEAVEELCGGKVLVSTKFSQLHGWKVAVDVSIFLNKYVKSSGPERWIDSFIILLITLKKYGIKSICIFDGPDYPPEKQHERERRRAENEKAKNVINYSKELYDKILLYDQDSWSSGSPKQKQISGEIKELITSKRGKQNEKIKVNYSLLESVTNALNDFIEKKDRQIAPILPEYSEMAKKLITILGMNWFQAPGEAEGLCASLCYHGMVDAVLSEDTDTLAYGAPFLFCKIDLKTESLSSVCYQDILKNSGYTSKQFTDLCILLSCDYNDRIKGYAPDGKKHTKASAIGVKGAVAMMTEYKSLEKAEPYILDPTPLKYPRCRVLFSVVSKEELKRKNFKIESQREVDYVALKEFIDKYTIRININYITNAFALQMEKVK
jgi:5'-3' exonuclease